MYNNNRIGHLHYWCQRILPVAYQNSLSYMELLQKVVYKLNETIDFANGLPDYIDQKIVESLDDEHLRELISEVFRTIEDAISANNEGTNTHFEHDYPNLGTLVWHDNKLYKTIRKIDNGDTIIPNVNIELVNFGDMFTEFLTEIKTRFTDNDDGDRETSSTDRTEHDLVWLHDELYEVIKPISEGNAYIYSGTNKNVQSINLDEIYDYLLDLIRSNNDAIVQESVDRENADIALQDNIDAEATAREEADGTLQDNIDAETLARTEAINNVETSFNNKLGNLDNLTTSNKANVVGAINEVNEKVEGLYDKADIRKYGGVADNTTDCTTAFIACLNENNMVYMPNYNNQAYKLNDITLTDGQSVIGTEGTKINSVANVLFTIIGNNVEIKNLIINTTTNVFYIDSAEKALAFINIENVYSYGANTFIYDNNAASYQYTNLYVTRCAARQHKSYGINLAKCFAFLIMTDVTIDCVGEIGIAPCFNIRNNAGCQLTRCEAEGGFTDGTHVSHGGFSFTECQAIWLNRCMSDTVDGVGFNFYNCQYTYMFSCAASLCGAHGIAILGATSQNFLITNCMLIGRRGLSIVPSGAHGIYNYNDYIQINNCEIFNFSGYAVADVARGTHNQYNNMNITNCDRSFVSSSGGGILCNMISAIADIPTFGNYTHRCVIANNILYDTPLGS